MTDESAELLAYSNALANDALGVVTVFEPRLVEYRGGPTTSSWIAFIKLLASVEETLFASMSFLTLASAGVKLSSNDKNLKRRTIASLEECATSVETRQLASASASTPAKDLDNVRATYMWFRALFIHEPSIDDVMRDPTVEELFAREKR